MVKCKICGEEMRKANGCKDNIIWNFKQGPMLRIPFRKGDQLGKPVNRRCHDCNCKIGFYHHPGCDMEKCPKCGGQHISCDCK